MPLQPNSDPSELVNLIESRLDRVRFQDQHWHGTFWDYLAICDSNPAVLRNAYQRLYDAVVARGREHYKLFKRPCEIGRAHV